MINMIPHYTLIALLLLLVTVHQQMLCEWGSVCYRHLMDGIAYVRQRQGSEGWQSWLQRMQLQHKHKQMLWQQQCSKVPVQLYLAQMVRQMWRWHRQLQTMLV